LDAISATSAAGRPALLASAWMALSIASFVLMMVAARQLTDHLATVEILLLRSLGALVILLALWPRLGAAAYATHRLRLHVIRNLIHFCGQYAWVWGITLAPLAVVTAIEFTTPVWVALLAAVFLRERIAPHRWAAIAGGIAGVLAIVHPGARAFGPAALIVLSGTFCYAGAIMIAKALLRTDRVTALVFYMSLLQLPMGLVGSLFVWVWPVWSDAPWIAAMGVTGLTAHYAMGKALSLGDASFVLPMDFLRLPCIALAALVIYGERIDAWTMLGALLIFAGNYLSVRQEARPA
jgi:drug/metabolite transporter (DMT)-like permease